MKSASPSRTQLLLAFATLYITWGSTYLAIRIAIQTLPPFLMAGARFIVAGGALYLWMLARGMKHPTAVQWRSSAIVGILLLGGGNGLVVWAESRVSSGLTALFISSMPLWIVLLDWVRPGGRRPKAGVMVGVLLGVVGMLYLIQPWNSAVFGAGKALDLIGVLALVGSTLCWATGSLFSKHLPMPHSPFLATAAEMLCGGLFLIVLGSALGQWHHTTWSAVSVASVLGWLYLVIFGSLAGFTAYIWLLKNTAPAQATTYAFVNPVIALVVGWWIAGEPLSGRIWLAAALILTAVAIILTQRSDVTEPENG